MKILKSLMILITLVGLIPTIKSNAKEALPIEKPLVVNVGADINNYLVYEDYIVVSNNVNTSQPGLYYVIYKNITTLEEVHKPVYVINDNKLVIEQNVLLNESKKATYSYVESVQANDSFGFISNYTSPNYNESMTCLYYENGYSSMLRNDIKTNIKDLKYVEDKYLWVGDQKSIMNGHQEIIYEVLDGKHSSKTIDLSGNQYADSITLTPNNILIAGHTDETSLDFPEERLGIDSYILFLNRENFTIDNSLMLPCEKNDLIISMVFWHNYVYALQSIETKTLRLMKIDLFGNIIGEKDFIYPYGTNNSELRLVDDTLLMSYSYYDYNYLDYVDRIEKIDENLKNEVLYDKYNKQLKMIDFNYPSMDTFQILLGYKNNNKGYVYEQYYKNELILDYYNSEFMPYALKHNNLILEKDGKVYVNKLNTLFVANLPKENYDPKFDNLDILNNYEVLINGKICQYCDKSMLDIDTNSFGNYLVTYFFDNDFDFVYQYNLYVEPFVGVIDNNNYQKGLVINGNGTTLINGEQVELPYTFTEVGHYTIQIIGKNSVLSELSIDIVENERKEEIDELTNDMNVIYKNTKSTPKLDINYQKRTTEIKHRNNFMFVYLAPLFVITIGYLLIRKEG